MHRVAATLEKFEDTINARRSTGDAKGYLWGEAKLHQPDDVGEVELFKRLVIRDVEEDGVALIKRPLHVLPYRLLQNERRAALPHVLHPCGGPLQRSGEFFQIALA